MTGSSCFWTTRCLSQMQLPGMMGRAWASGRAAQGSGAWGLEAQPSPQERQHCLCTVAVGLLGAALLRGTSILLPLHSHSFTALERAG